MKTFSKQLITFLLFFALTPLCLLGALETKPWTIMVYMLGDNDLEESAVDDLNEMLSAGTGKNVNLVILADRGSNYSQANVGGIKSWKTPKLLTPGSTTKYKELADWGKANMGDPATLTRFIKESTAQFPAEHYGLFFWDHGGGWSGFGVDESADSGLSLEVISKGVSGGLSAAKLSALDIIGFDACLMASYEAMAKLQKFATWYLASEELEPGHGWDWRSLSALEKNPSSDGAALGNAILKGYMAHAAAQGDQDEVTLSLVDLSNFGILEKAVGAFTDGAKKEIVNFAPALGRSAGSTLAYGKAGKPEEDTNMLDLGAFVKAAAVENPKLGPQRDAVIAALGKVVVAKDAGKPLKNSSGISIYFPNRKKFYDAGYDTAGPSLWRDFLASYYGTGTPPSTKPAANAKPIGPVFLVDENLGESDVQGDTITLSASLNVASAKNVVDSLFSYGIVSDDSTVFLGDSPASIDIDSGLVEGSWDGQVLQLRQGKLETYGYLSLSSTEEGDNLYSIPFAYFKTGKINPDTYDYVYMDITFSDEGEVLSSALYKESDNGMLAELKPVKGS